eukprot:TRINITY_DN2423_c0_g1_i2.p1 TRINITY_DN2423_c0_g1~~TRINITY_DN2423_c0_g1_i2.p1  ORF type:complete len:271 (-),score=57.53 TRINITY_DN2423_c0_g1_i2:43-855(-)
MIEENLNGQPLHDNNNNLWRQDQQHMQISAQDQLQKERLLLQRKLKDVHENILSAFEDSAWTLIKTGESNAVVDDAVVNQVNIGSLLLLMMIQETRDELQGEVGRVLEETSYSIEQYETQLRARNEKAYENLTYYLNHYKRAIEKRGEVEQLELKKPVELNPVEHAEELNAFAQNLFNKREEITQLNAADLQTLETSANVDHPLTNQTLNRPPISGPMSEMPPPTTLAVKRSRQEIQETTPKKSWWRFFLLFDSPCTCLLYTSPSPRDQA